MRRWIALLSLALSACIPAAFVVQQDPAQVPAKSQAVAVVVDQGSITARQLLPVLEQQMAAQGINRVDDPQAASWVLDFTVQNQFSATQTKNGEAINPGSTLQLNLIAIADYQAGRQKPVWSASSNCDPQVLSDRAPAIIGRLLEHYGQNYVGGGLSPF